MCVCCEGFVWAVDTVAGVPTMPPKVHSEEIGFLCISTKTNFASYLNAMRRKVSIRIIAVRVSALSAGL
jgi:hypothetical protein